MPRVKGLSRVPLPPAMITAVLIMSGDHVPRFTQIVLVGEKRFLDYNKTKIMHQVIESLPLSYRFVDISSDSQRGLLKKLGYLFAYLRLFFSLGKDARRQILWLSEWKFT